MNKCRGAIPKFLVNLDFLIVSLGVKFCHKKGSHGPF